MLYIIKDLLLDDIRKKFILLIEEYSDVYFLYIIILLSWLSFRNFEYFFIFFELKCFFDVV